MGVVADILSHVPDVLPSIRSSDMNTEELIDRVQAQLKEYPEVYGAVYFREMLKLALTHPLNQRERDFIIKTLERDLRDFQSE